MWVNLHFRCRAWLAQILDANHCALLPEHLSHVWVIMHEDANMWTCSVLLIFPVFCIKWLCPLSAASSVSNYCQKRGKSYRSYAIKFGYFTICFVQAQICMALYCIFNFFSELTWVSCMYCCSTFFFLMTNCFPSDKISKWQMKQTTGWVIWRDKQED